MDDRNFDALSRAFGGVSRRTTLAALLGLGALAGAAPVEAKRRKRRKRCDPRCPEGQTCRKGRCACDDGSAVCGAACCTPGQSCEGGQCIDPLAGCIALGDSCTETARRCCAGLECTRGQGGPEEIACFAPAGGACATTVDCAFGSECVDGVCKAPEEPPTGSCTVCAFGCPHSTIEAAIEAASPGAVIAIAPGTYSPPGVAERRDEYALKITKPLTLTSCGAYGRVTIMCPREISRGLDCILVRNTTVTLARLDLVGPGSDSETVGFYLETNQEVFPPPEGKTFVRIVDCSVGGVRGGLSVSAARAFVEDRMSISDSVYGLRAGSIESITCDQPVSFSPSVGQRCYGSGTGVWGCGC